MFKIEGTKNQGYSYCDKCKLVKQTTNIEPRNQTIISSLNTLK